MIYCDPKILSSLNDLLGRELGRNERGEPLFSWAWSEDLFWPAFRTGRMIRREKKIQALLIGGGSDLVDLGEVVPEYKRVPQVSRKCWNMTRWLGPVDLIYGGSGGHGWDRIAAEPSLEALKAMWESQFPGCDDFPSQGVRWALDVWLPREPGGTAIPNRADTLDFIRLMKEQTSMSSRSRLIDMMNAEDRKQEKLITSSSAEIEDCFSAFLNPNPGARGGHVSFPFTSKDGKQ